MPKDQFIIVMGDPIDGFTMIGPFDSPEEADLHGLKYIDDDYWVTNLCTPVSPIHS